MKRFFCAVVILCLIFSGCSVTSGNNVANEASMEPKEMESIEPKKEERVEQEKEKNVSLETETIKRAYFSVAVRGEEELILDLTVVELEEDETVLAILKRLLKENKIHIETSGRGDAEYVKAINNIYEFDKGPQSGWMFYVNDEMPNEGAGKLIVNDGDMIDWVFVTDWGEME